MCIGNNLGKELDEAFELRMVFYKNYPDFSEDLYIDLKSMLRQQEIRTIRLIAFWLESKIESKDYQIFRDQTDLLISDNSLRISNGETVIDILLPYIPASDSWEVKYSEWSGRYMYMCGIERCCVELVKKANLSIIANSPEVFGTVMSHTWEKDIMYLMKLFYQGWYICQRTLVIRL